MLDLARCGLMAESNAAFTGRKAIGNATSTIAAQTTVAHPVTMEQLLEDVPLHSRQPVEELFDQPQFGNVKFPGEIRMHCEHPKCDGVRRHTRLSSDRQTKLGESFYYFALYLCENCRLRLKVFGLKAERQSEHHIAGFCTKIYQDPPFGQPIPRNLFHIIGEANREHFLQARRAIARGLGIGAYAYYRRIVENTKFDLIDSVLEVAQATKALPEQVGLLKKAQSERQFSKAIQILSDASAIPPILLIAGHNPLSLLHDLLSEGIHQLDDEECLKRAQEAEVILYAIADRMQTAVTEQKEVKAALASILKRKTQDATGATEGGNANK